MIGSGAPPTDEFLIVALPSSQHGCGAARHTRARYVLPLAVPHVLLVCLLTRRAAKTVAGAGLMRQTLSGEGAIEGGMQLMVSTRTRGAAKLWVFV